MSNTIIAGVGGQGTVLASKLLAQAALLEGHMVRTAETIGMAQRGGTVLGHVRITRESTFGGGRVDARTAASSDAPLSPLIPEGTASLLIGFEPGETLRALPFLRKGGAVVTAKQVLRPPTASLGSKAYDGRAELDYLEACLANRRIGSLIVVDGAALCQTLGSFKVLNVILLGAALTLKSIEITQDSLAAALETLVKPHYLELNKQALEAGINYAHVHEGEEA